MVALALIFLCSHQLDKTGYGTFVLGLTVVGIVNAATGGLTAATGVQVSSQKRPAGTALANGGVLGLGLGAAAVLAGLVVSQMYTGDAHREALAVGFACAAVIVSSVVAGRSWLEAFIRYNLALVAPPLLSLILITFAFFVLGKKSPAVALDVRPRTVARHRTARADGGPNIPARAFARRARGQADPAICRRRRGGERDLVLELPGGCLVLVDHWEGRESVGTIRWRCTSRSRSGR